MRNLVQQSYADRGAGSPGSLYLVATPIGNLEDMTYRAVRILQECDIIAAEDTRQSRKLLTHFEIPAKPLFSYHEHNKAASGPEIIRYIIEGKNVALVSDAGLPAISDPGSDLVSLAIEAGISVIPIPGANAALSALIVSGLPTERFTFIGFLPRERKDIVQQLQALQSAQGTLLFYESPHRVKKTLEILQEVLGNRKVTLARELTKRYEELCEAAFPNAWTGSRSIRRWENIVWWWRPAVQKRSRKRKMPGGRSFRWRSMWGTMSGKD